jgi:futalosine hydrolase
LGGRVSVRRPWRRLLIVVAVEAERAAVLSGLSGLDIVVQVAGVGMAAAAATTARLLLIADQAGAGFDAVLSAGIGGGFAGRAGVGATVLATLSIAADFGADSPAGFLPADQLGLGPSTIEVDAALLDALRAALPQAVMGSVLTVSTVTGTAAETADLTSRYPDAAAEAMEGFAVATAAGQAGVPFAELRTISNLVGPRDRSSWRIADALDRLRLAASGLAGLAARV